MDDMIEQTHGLQDDGMPGGKPFINPADPLEMSFLIELPEHVEIQMIPRLTEIKQIW